MAIELDLADIQGNILIPYAWQGFAKGRCMLFHIGNDTADADANAKAGRKFVTGLLPMITTALPWAPAPPPPVTMNIAFTWYGLVALGIPTRTLRGMPDEFIDGMIKRAPMLGDDFKGEKWKDSWDKVWLNPGLHPDSVHILIMLNAQMNRDGSAVPELAAKAREIDNLCQQIGRVRLLTGHNLPGRPKQDFQELSALMEQKSDGKATPLRKEHFGFTDGIGDPVFEGQYPSGAGQALAVGHGALDGKGNWRPLATGEFLLGYPDEAQETPGATMPLDFSRNGTFMAYRKLHENVAAFKKFLDKTAEQFSAVTGIQSHKDARDTVMAKMAGRWPDGVPLSRAPTIDEWHKFNDTYKDVDPKVDPAGAAAREAALSDFKFRYINTDGTKDIRDDPDGTRCPLTAHMRRVNTRDMMGPTAEGGSVLTNRRRILRRGLPYGSSPEGTLDTDEHGVVMLIVCANLFRQFEFVQQQWINYGLDAGAGSDTCPIVGNHSDGTPGGKHGPAAKFVIPPDPASGQPPFIVEGIPQFVETRGGEYFFVPSMTALRMIGMGVVDPT
jgi:Dyp-type peroxidase family